ncbi:MAG: single-stranded DNA-binding protein [Anaerolineae bacterium]|nr:single-stranded DNA-binding protein [Anaerolineales bacterium]MCK6627097.1 single-stranded DNA-binding protein [Anaerolineae bacterium]MCQ3977110.1 single-stranded DNA-binding protein [Anaerolineae bacterium]
MYQKLIIVGNLGGDPEMRYTPSGQAVTNFSVATSRKWTDNGGQQHEETVWFRVSVWGAQAETCNQYLSKGRQVLCEGRLTVDKETGGPRVWTDQNGKPRASYEMTAYEVRFLGTRGEGGGNFSSNGAPVAAGTDPGLTEDEIPF